MPPTSCRRTPARRSVSAWLRGSPRELALLAGLQARLRARGAQLVGAAIAGVDDQRLIGLERTDDGLAAAAREDRHELRDRADRLRHVDVEARVLERLHDRIGDVGG